MKRYLLVLLAPMTASMTRMQTAHLHDAGIPTTECDTVYLLNGEMPDGAKDTPSKSQLNRTEPKFRAEMLSRWPEIVIPVGPEAFRAVTGLTWPIDEARGYAIPPDLCRPHETRVQVENGVYKSGAKKGTTKMSWTKVGTTPPIPPSVKWIVPTLSWKQYVKGRRRQVTAVTSALETAAAMGREEPLEIENFDFVLPYGEESDARSL